MHPILSLLPFGRAELLVIAVLIGIVVVPVALVIFFVVKAGSGGKSAPPPLPRQDSDV